MLIFTIIAIVLIFFLWFNTSVFDYKGFISGYSYNWRIDRDSERRLPFTLWRVIGSALLLIPWWNIGIFIIYLVWYLKKAAEPECDNRHECIIYDVNVKKYSPFLYDALCFIGEILNKRIV